MNKALGALKRQISDAIYRRFVDMVRRRRCALNIELARSDKQGRLFTCSVAG